MNRRLMMAQAESNILMLYNYGNECESVTGGWIEKGFIRGTNRRTEKQGNQMLLYADNFNDEITAVTLSTVKAIDISSYSKICVEWEVTNTTSTNLASSTLLTMAGVKNGNSYANSAIGDINWATQTGFTNKAINFSGISEKVFNSSKLPAPVCHFTVTADVWNIYNKSSAQIIVRRLWLEK